MFLSFVKRCTEREVKAGWAPNDVSVMAGEFHRCPAITATRYPNLKTGVRPYLTLKPDRNENTWNKMSLVDVRVLPVV